MKSKLTAACFFLIVFLSYCSDKQQTTQVQTKPDPSKEKDSLAFGDKNWITDGLEGKIYYLPDTTSRMPDFSALKDSGSIYTKTIDVPNRSWNSGFPGVG